ncbi:hypothetical protein F2Q68_00028175 [Brassica cretica]|uniref:Uncharacterized protein n=1 Tax=Brassica cretica TaxID=69181 RepID=A0A8S9IB33_BRACR|nr:hypothetical protein F2Q68_00028175 [Brassica cretica]
MFFSCSFQRDNLVDGVEAKGSFLQSDDLVLVYDGPLERFLGGLLPSCEMDLDARLETRRDNLVDGVEAKGSFLQSDDLVLVYDGPLERFLGGLLPSCEMDLDARLETRVLIILNLSLNLDESCDDVANNRTDKHEF